ncbi:M23 family metallopeptidase [uncultured Sphingomonas sp.]|uniref:M23 family metallopeptidase n=1 Tax=uncultured Sphingomonas sp. TaxID=158754 RepID=UPI0026071A10|nr:M23 family metallopeptidase [uncultured Sphingomonas sp.]
MGTPAFAAPPTEMSRRSLPAANFRPLLDAWTSGGDRGSQPPVSIPLERPIESFRYTSPFGVRADPFHGERSFHAGVDLAAPTGTPVHATGDAIVTRAEPAAGYGNVVILMHGAGIETRYGHLSRILVKAGQRVRRGETIGMVGSSGRSSGSHLHYEIRVAGQAINPLPFMAPGDERLALNAVVGPHAGIVTAMGGPEDKEGCLKLSDGACEEQQAPAGGDRGR